MPQPFVDPPEFVNEIGTKFWHNKDSTEYARKPRYTLTGEHQDGLKGYACWYVEMISKERQLILVDAAGNVVYETQTLDALGTYIDVLKFLHHDRKAI